MDAVLGPFSKAFRKTGFLGEIIAFRLVLWQLIIQHLTLRYRRTVLGFVWTLINPLMTMTVTAAVFSFVMKVPVKNFPVFLFAGSIPWIFFSSCITHGGMSILNSEGLIKKIYVPRHIFPLAVVIALLLENLLSTVALFFIALALGAQISWALLILPVSFAIMFVFCLGFGLFFSVVFVYFRDMQQITNVLLQVLYYGTPILYPMTMVPSKVAWIMRFNPMTHMVALFQKPIHEGVVPPMHTLGFATLLAVASLVIGWRVFKSCANNLVFRL